MSRDAAPAAFRTGPLTPRETNIYYRELEGVDVAPYPEVADTFGALRA